MALRIESGENRSIISRADGADRVTRKDRSIGSRSRFGFAISLSLLFAVSAFSQSGDRQLANSKQPYFQSFSSTIPHRTQEGQVIYSQGAFAWNGHPAVALIPDGRIFIVWSPQIGFARGGRLTGSFSSDGGRTWSEAIELINILNRDDADPSIIVDGHRLLVISGSWPVPETFDKFNPWPTNRARAWFYMTTSEDAGKTWSQPVLLDFPHASIGKRANGLRLEDGSLLLPYYYDAGSELGKVPRLEGDMRSISLAARSTDGGRNWVSGEEIVNCGADNCDEPAVVQLSNGELYCLMRTMTEHPYESRSRDQGRTWDTPKPSSILATKNNPFAFYRMEKGHGDELIAAWNYPDRTSLVAAFSPDGGKTWTAPKLVARPNSQAGYWADNPSICETKDGLIVVAWQQETLPRHLGKEVAIARFNRAWLTSR